MSTPFDPSTMFHEFRFHAFLKETFGIDLSKHLLANGSDVYIIQPDKASIDFQDHGHNFVLSQSGNNWELSILHNEDRFITNIVEVPAHVQCGDMVLTFHAVKSEMIVELDLYVKQTQSRSFEEELREQRNQEILPVLKLTLPNTSIDLAEWECQLILNFVASGCNPKEAIKNAKQLITLQLNAPGGNPGDLSYYDKCKPSIDQK
jgi:hypothetical protein